MPRSWKKLTSALESSGQDTVEMTFQEVSDLVGELPTELMADAGWWRGSPDRPRTKSWTRAGYSVDEVDVARGVVRFKRT